MTVERRGDLAAARERIVCEQCGRGNQYARKAIAALAGLLVEERLLQRRERTVVRQSLDGRHGLSGKAFDWTHARERRLAVDEHHAGAALLRAAAEPAAAQGELVAQHRQQRPRPVAF